MGAGDWILNEMAGSWLFWVVSCGLAALGTVGTWQAVWRWMRDTEVADGTVVGLEDTTYSDEATLYRSIVVFAVGGTEHRVTDSMASRPAAHKVGDPVRVFYPPGRPDEARIGRWRYARPFLWLAGAGWGCLTAMLVWRLG